MDTLSLSLGRQIHWPGRQDTTSAYSPSTNAVVSINFPFEHHSVIVNWSWPWFAERSHLSTGSLRNYQASLLSIYLRTPNKTKMWAASLLGGLQTQPISFLHLKDRLWGMTHTIRDASFLYMLQNPNLFYFYLSSLMLPFLHSVTYHMVGVVVGGRTQTTNSISVTQSLVWGRETAGSMSTKNTARKSHAKKK